MQNNKKVFVCHNINIKTDIIMSYRLLLKFPQKGLCPVRGTIDLPIARPKWRLDVNSPPKMAS